MRRALTSAFAAALVALGAAGNAQAQDMVVRTAPQFDIGIFAGGAYTTDWFSIRDEGYKPGLSPVFGAEATFWLSPTFGLRLDGKYLPSHMPQRETESDRWLENVWTYDLDLVWRPMFWSGTGFMSSMYVFAGGGGLTADPPGTGECLGIAQFTANGVCVSGTAKHGSVGQGVAGLGFDVFPLMSGLGVFLEAGVHGYDSPAHVAENAQSAEDKFTFTPYAVLGLKLGFGNIIPPPPPPPPAPLPQPLPPPEPAPTPPPPPQDVNYCVVQNGQLTSVTVQYRPVTGDTTYNGQPVSTAVPATTGYAGSETWYINTEPIQFNGRRYVKYGLPRILGTSDVNNVGTVNNVSVFAEPSANAQRPEVIYVPTRPGCEFQPYQIEVKGSFAPPPAADHPPASVFSGSSISYRLRGSFDAVFNALQREFAGQGWASAPEIHAGYGTIITRWDYEPVARGADREYRTSHLLTIEEERGSRCSTVTVKQVSEWRGSASVRWDGDQDPSHTPRRDAGMRNILRRRAACP